MGCGTTKTARQNAAERNLWTSLDIVVGGGEARRDAARHVAPRRRPKVAEQRLGLGLGLGLGSGLGLGLGLTLS